MTKPQRLHLQFTLRALLALFVFVWSAITLMGVPGLLLLLIALLVCVLLAYGLKRSARVVVLTVALLGVAIAFLLPALPIAQVRHTVRMKHCVENMEAVAEAIASYRAEHGHYPPACVRDADGRPMHSWRVLILPYLGYDDLYDAYRFDEPWNGPSNSKLLDSIPDEYLCPELNWPSTDKGVTTCVAAVGPKTVWSNDTAVDGLPIADGAEQTILIGEVDSQCQVRWLEPKDIEFDDAVTGLKLPEPRTGNTAGKNTGHRLVTAHCVNGIGFSAVVAMADGSVRGLPENTSTDKLRALLTCAGGETVNIDLIASARLNPSKLVLKPGKLIAGLLLVVSFLVIVAAVAGLRWERVARREAPQDLANAGDTATGGKTVEADA